jgi:UDP-3-O-[3-hydroxymyristoyl] glucosamine N-acyltransferase
MTDTTWTLATLAQWIDGTVEGDETVTVARLAPIDQADGDSLTFALDERRVAQLADSTAGAAIIPADADATGIHMPVVRVERVDHALAVLLSQFAPTEDVPPVGIHPSAVIADSATVGNDVAIGPNVVVGENTTIGDRTVLCANVTVGSKVVLGEDNLVGENTTIKTRTQTGKAVRIGPGCVIGYDGFGYFFADGQHHLIPHLGNVILEDDVHLGACVCVDRGKFGPTRVGAGTKVDNLVQIAHNVQTGRNCILVGQCGIAGSAVLGDGVVLGGSSGVRDNVTLGDGAQLAAYSATASNIPAGEGFAGTPARPMSEFGRINAVFGKLPELNKRIRKLESLVEKLQAALDNQA